MSKHLVRVLFVMSGLALLPGLVRAQAPATAAPSESLPSAQVTSAPSAPIVQNWTLHKLKGSVNLVVNPDGTWIFSGGFADKKPGHNFDITFALKSSTGAIYLFHYEGDAANGVQFSKQGESPLLKDDFATFAHHHWSASYVFHLNEEGRLARYEALEKKREAIHKAEVEARKRHDEKVVAEKKAEERQEASAEYQWELQYAQQHGGSSGGGGGSSVSSVCSTITSIAGTASSVIGDIAGLF